MYCIWKKTLYIGFGIAEVSHIHWGFWNLFTSNKVGHTTYIYTCICISLICFFLYDWHMSMQYIDIMNRWSIYINKICFHKQYICIYICICLVNTWSHLSLSWQCDFLQCAGLSHVFILVVLTVWDMVGYQNIYW
jgi:hypothetical protein